MAEIPKNAGRQSGPHHRKRVHHVLLLLEASLGPVFLAPHPLEALLLLLLEACLALGLLGEQLLLVEALFFFKALPTSIVFSVALLASLLLEPESLLTIVLLLG